MMKTLLIISLLILASCNSENHFEAIFESPDKAISGDIIVVSGGTVATTATPFPLHKVALFNSEGVFKRFLYEATTNERLYGGTIDSTTNDFLFGIDTVDRVDKIDLNSFDRSSAILDPTLTGTTLRTLSSLSDGSIVVAESPTVIEKFSSAGVRAAAPFPIAIPTAINSIKTISGNRFVVTFTTNPDAPRVYNNSGTLAATFPTTSPCTTNCDPFDVVELPDGRFVVNSRVTHGLYLYSSTFTYVGVLYLNSSILNTPSAMTVLGNGNIAVCSTSFNNCEEFSISGNTATRVGTSALINNTSAIRQPLSIMVVP
jgi:hypothetical protein